VILVDGMNVIGSRADGWWRDRRGAMRALVEALETLAASEIEPITVIFDGRSFELPGRESSVDVRFAPRGGPNAADDEIVALVADANHPADIHVVTSDLDLIERVRALGATSEGAGAFRRRLDAL
jgi:predicted RNA-binding protein with PIN domain